MVNFGYKKSIIVMFASLILGFICVSIPTTAFADDGENVFTYLFGQHNGNEYDARIPYEDYNNSGEIRFNDKWLNQDTTQYNNALSSFCANCSEKIEQNKDSINYYLKENNFGNAYFGGDEKPNGWSGFYCISHKIVEVDGKQSVVLFICCRGTQRLSEVIGDYFRGNNVNFLNSQIYDNVYDFEENVYEGLISYSENHYIDENHFVKLKDMMSNNLKVIVTGHSLGGAAADAVAAKLNYEAGSDNWWLHKIQKSDVFAYTYGAIKVLGDNCNDDTNLEDGYENIHNVYNWSDSFGPYGSRKDFNVSVPKKKFGHTETFDCDKQDFGLWPFFPFESTYSASHNMPTYIEAINNESKSQKDNSHYLSLSCSCHSSIILDINNSYHYKEINKFLSAFSQDGASRIYNNDDEASLLYWAYNHHFHNQNIYHTIERGEWAKELQPEKYSGEKWFNCIFDTRIRVSNSQQSIKKYFGKDLNVTLSGEVEKENVYIKDDYYYSTETGGNIQKGFALITNLQDLGNDYYCANFDIYGIGMGPDAQKEEVYSYSPSVAQQVFPSSKQVGRATFKVNKTNGNLTFIIQDFYRESLYVGGY